MSLKIREDLIGPDGSGFDNSARAVVEKIDGAVVYMWPRGYDATAADYPLDSENWQPARDSNHFPDCNLIRAYKSSINGNMLAEILPDLETLNAWKRQSLEPYGAHDWPFVIADTDSENPTFGSKDLVEAYAHRIAPISSDAFFYLHDIANHSLNMALMPQDAADQLQTLSTAALDLWNGDDTDLAQAVANTIAEGVDIGTDMGRRQLKNPTTNHVLLSVVREASLAKTAGQFILDTLRSSGTDIVKQTDATYSRYDVRSSPAAITYLTGVAARIR